MTIAIHRSSIADDDNENNLIESSKDDAPIRIFNRNIPNDAIVTTATKASSATSTATGSPSTMDIIFNHSNLSLISQSSYVYYMSTVTASLASAASPATTTSTTTTTTTPTATASSVAGAEAQRNDNNHSISNSRFIYDSALAAEIGLSSSPAHDAINRTFLLSAAGTGSGTAATMIASTAAFDDLSALNGTNSAASSGAGSSNSPLEEEDWSHFYDIILSWQGICLITVFCTFIVITIIGNTLVILAVITTRRLKTVTNCFVMSLAVADLLVGIFVMPPAVAVHLLGSWQLGWVLCDIWISLDVLLCTASILSLCAISVDRYLAVTQPLNYSRKRRSKRLALIMILIVWILAFGITCPPMLGWYEPGRRDLSECRYNQNEGYVIFSAMGSFFIPMAVMIYVYARISCVIASRHDNMTDISVHNKKFKRYTSADVENDIEHDLSEQEGSSGQKKQAAARTFSNQTIAKELHELMLSEGAADNPDGHGLGSGSGSASHCHSLVALSPGNMKNGCYELTRPSSLKRGSSTLSPTTMTTTTSSGGGSVQPQVQIQLTRPHSIRLNPHHQHQHQHPSLLTTSKSMNSAMVEGDGGGGGVGVGVEAATSVHSSPHIRDTSLTPVTLRQNRSQPQHPVHQQHHHRHHTPKSLSNRISSLKKENKTTQTLSIVVGGFIACWLPFFVYYLITPFLEEHQVSRTLAKALTWLGWFNSAINPFIYAFYSVDFRAAFWRLTCKRFWRSATKPQYPSNTMSIRR